MGEVYRARDTRLNREVAIKVLPEHLSSNPELRERFEREARAISQLSHPHICVLYDIGKHEGADYLVLEYLEGETLGARLRRGPLPTEQVLKYGAQMAEALDKAHRHGVVHRDLKPDNVMLTKSGIKLLDFGLAKPVLGAVGVASSVAATMTHSPLTTEGTLVGTFQYMSPEQLEGQEADARSDIFGLGCVLYEMVTGRRAFEGKSTAKVVAAIMTTEPPAVTTLSPLTPAPLERVIKKCLAKDPEERWQNAGDLASELRWISESGSQSGVVAPAPVRSQRKLLLPWFALALVSAAGILTGFLLRRPIAQPTARLAVNLPPGGSLAQNQTVVLSPNGQMVVMDLVDAEGKARLWVRRLSSDTAQPMLDTDGAINPFWSPDSQYVGFFSIDGKVRKILATGGDRSEAVTATSWSVYGGSWGPAGTILFSSGHLGLYQVSASGGTAVKVPMGGNGGADYRWPSFLPDGKHVLVTSNSAAGGIFAVSVTTGEVQPVLPGENGQAQYVEPGYILFLRGGTLLAQPFDLRSLHATGSAQSIAESVSFGFSASGNGLLLFQHASQAQLTWVDPQGKKLSTVGDPGYLSTPYLSPNVAVRDEAKGLRMTRLEQTMGLRGMPEGELTFENLEVPADMAVLPPSGFRRGFADLMNAYNSQRVGAGTVAMGIAAGALDLALDWTRTREQFGRKIGEFQGLQWMLADMQTQLTASRLMLYAAARSRGPGGSAFPDPMLAAQAKIFASESAIKIVNDALQFFGARGYSRELPLERMARDVRMFTIGGGTAQVLRTLVASKMLGWKLPQTRDGYLPKPSMRDAAE